MRDVFWAFIEGIKDGHAQPWEMGVGMTYHDKPYLNGVYDHGANLGQLVGRVFNRGAV